MSVWDLKVTIYIYMAIGVCVALYPALLKNELSRNAIIFWVVLVPFLTIMRIPVLTFLVIPVLLYYIQRQASNPQRLFLFIAILAAVPLWFEFMIEFGATEIYEIRHWKLLVLIILFPALVDILKVRLKFDFVDVVFFAFVAYIILHYLFFDQRLTFLSAVRLGFDEFLYYFIVYFVFSRVVSQQPREAIKYASLGFVILGLILSGVFVFNQAISADLYHVHTTAGNVYNSAFIREFRGGFLRTEGPLAGESMGLIFAVAALSLFSMRAMFNTSLFKFLVVFGLFFLGVLITGSRGVLFTFLLVSAVFTYMRLNNAAIKMALLFFFCVGSFIYFILLSGGVPVQDEFGTFDFRAQLWETSFDFINKHPFGDSLYASHHYFDHLRRGPARFLDVVSVYLVVWLPMGYPGLILYTTPFLITVLQLAGLIMLKPQGLGVFGEAFKLYLAMLIGFLFMIFTVSDVGLISMLGVIFLAISRGLIHAHAGAQKIV